jgi:DNA-directed RNA polymerase subunit RPC12/RpoP
MKKANPYGCGAWNCYDCYPYQYSCDDCSEMFSEPIENGSEYECEHCGYESFKGEREMCAIDRQAFESERRANLV